MKKAAVCRKCWVWLSSWRYLSVMMRLKGGVLVCHVTEQMMGDADPTVTHQCPLKVPVRTFLTTLERSVVATQLTATAALASLWFPSCD